MKIVVYRFMLLIDGCGFLQSVTMRYKISAKPKGAPEEPTHMDGDGEWTVFDAHFSGGFVVLLRPIDVLRPEL